MNPDILFSELRKAADDEGRDWAAEARRLQEAVAGSLAGSKMHYLVGRILELAAGRTDLRILDFGCGGARLVFFLRLLGFSDVHGVDVSPHHEELSRKLAVRLGMSPDMFATYDMVSLPYADASFDLVVSEEVLEHVHNLDDYYREAARVLRPGGSALLLFPHRTMPFDSHSRTWFVHYLPKPLRLKLHDRLTKQGGEYFAQRLNLRTLPTHRAIALRHFTTYSLNTARRLREAGYLAHYKGSRGLRAAAQKLIEAPVLGSLACWAFSYLAEAEVVLVK